MRIAIVSSTQAYLYLPHIGKTISLYSGHGNVKALVEALLLPTIGTDLKAHTRVTMQSTEDTQVIQIKK